MWKSHNILRYDIAEANPCCETHTQVQLIDSPVSDIVHADTETKAIFADILIL